MIYSNCASFSYFHITYIALNTFSIIENKFNNIVTVIYEYLTNKFNNIVTVIYEYLTNMYSIPINVHTDK